MADPVLRAQERVAFQEWQEIERTAIDAEGRRVDHHPVRAQAHRRWWLAYCAMTGHRVNAPATA